MLSLGKIASGSAREAGGEREEKSWRLAWVGWASRSSGTVLYCTDPLKSTELEEEEEEEEEEEIEEDWDGRRDREEEELSDGFWGEVVLRLTKVCTVVNLSKSTSTSVCSSTSSFPSNCRILLVELISVYFQQFINKYEFT
jgi:hypothetical protein